MATRAQRDAERRRRQAAGLDTSDTAITAAIGALDTSYTTSSSDSGSSCTSYSSDCGTSNC